MRVMTNGALPASTPRNPARSGMKVVGDRTAGRDGRGFRAAARSSRNIRGSPM